MYRKMADAVGEIAIFDNYFPNSRGLRDGTITMLSVFLTTFSKEITIFGKRGYPRFPCRKLRHDKHLTGVVNRRQQTAGAI